MHTSLKRSCTLTPLNRLEARTCTQASSKAALLPSELPTQTQTFPYLHSELEQIREEPMFALHFTDPSASYLNECMLQRSNPPTCMHATTPTWGASARAAAAAAPESGLPSSQQDCSIGCPAISKGFLHAESSSIRVGPNSIYTQYICPILCYNPQIYGVYIRFWPTLSTMLLVDCDLQQPGLAAKLHKTQTRGA